MFWHFDHLRILFSFFSNDLSAACLSGSRKRLCRFSHESCPNGRYPQQLFPEYARGADHRGDRFNSTSWERILFVFWDVDAFDYFVDANNETTLPDGYLRRSDGGFSSDLSRCKGVRTEISGRCRSLSLYIQVLTSRQVDYFLGRR